MSQALVSPSSEPSAQSQKSSFKFEEPNEIFTGGWNPNALHSCLGLPLADAQKLVSVICVLLHQACTCTRTGVVYLWCMRVCVGPAFASISVAIPMSVIACLCFRMCSSLYLG